MAAVKVEICKFGKVSFSSFFNMNLDGRYHEFFVLLVVVILNSCSVVSLISVWIGTGLSQHPPSFHITVFSVMWCFCYCLLVLQDKQCLEANMQTACFNRLLIKGNRSHGGGDLDHCFSE